MRRAVPADRRGELEALCAWHRILHSASEPRRDELARIRERAIEGRPETPLGVALAAALLRFALPPNLLRGPFQALASDEEVRTFTTRGEQTAHLKRLVVPEGRLLLKVLGLEGERAEVLADALALGLQRARWTASMRRELSLGRLRIPAEDLRAFDVLPADLERDPAPPAVRELLGGQVAWARSELAKGWPLCHELGHRVGRGLTFLLRWHAASLSALEARGFDPRATAGGSGRGKAFRGGLLRALACASQTATRGAPRLQ